MTRHFKLRCPTCTYMLGRVDIERRSIQTGPWVHLTSGRITCRSCRRVFHVHDMEQIIEYVLHGEQAVLE